MSPVIILGMHRSGTSLVTRLLSDLGLFVGCDLQSDYESVALIRCNDWVLRQDKATWDHPERMASFLRDEKRRKRLAERLRTRFASRSIPRYAGAARMAGLRRDLSFDYPWGWKDPRNTFTLPVWLEIYPDARIIHVARHGVDVAQSLVMRQARLAERVKTGIKALAVNWPRRVDGSYASITRCATMEGAFSLWETYMQEAVHHVSSLGHRAHEVSYEEFLAQPKPALEEISRFAGLNIDPARLESAVISIRMERALAYQREPSLREFANSVKGRLSAWKY